MLNAVKHLDIWGVYESFVHFGDADSTHRLQSRGGNEGQRR